MAGPGGRRSSTTHVVAAIVQRMALALEVGQGTRDERHACNAGDRRKARPLIFTRPGKPRGNVVLRLTENADAPQVCDLPGRKAHHVAGNGEQYERGGPMTPN